MDDLKPCPFCGGEADPCHEGLGYVSVRCKKCGVVQHALYTWDAAIAAWNTRPIEDALRAEIARLREENARYQKGVPYVHIGGTLTATMMRDKIARQLLGEQP